MSCSKLSRLVIGCAGRFSLSSLVKLWETIKHFWLIFYAHIIRHQQEPSGQRVQSNICSNFTEGVRYISNPSLKLCGILCSTPDARRAESSRPKMSVCVRKVNAPIAYDKGKYLLISTGFSIPIL